MGPESTLGTSGSEFLDALTKWEDSLYTRALYKELLGTGLNKTEKGWSRKFIHCSLPPDCRYTVSRSLTILHYAVFIMMDYSLKMWARVNSVFFFEEVAA